MIFYDVRERKMTIEIARLWRRRKIRTSATNRKSCIRDNLKSCVYSEFYLNGQRIHCTNLVHSCNRIRCLVSNNIYPVKLSVPYRKLQSEPLHQDEFESRRIERVPLWSDINCRMRQRLSYAFGFDVWIPDGWYSCGVPFFLRRMSGGGAWNKREIYEQRSNGRTWNVGIGVVIPQTWIFNAGGVHDYQLVTCSME